MHDFQTLFIAILVIGLPCLLYALPILLSVRREQQRREGHRAPARRKR
jgi:hypothetical protein